MVVVVGICMVFACDGRTMVEGIDDEQTNGINFIPFVCPSRTPIRGQRADDIPTPKDGPWQLRFLSNVSTGFDDRR